MKPSEVEPPEIEEPVISWQWQLALVLLFLAGGALAWWVIGLIG